MRAVFRTSPRLQLPAFFLILAVAFAGTLNLISCGFATAPLPPNAEEFIPPAVYARWWAMTEACSGRSGDLASLRWYHVPGFVVEVNGEDASGYWSPSGNRIVLTDEIADDGASVRHEMLHALLRASGHPRAQFLGVCASLVNCQRSCVTDGGRWHAPSTYAVVPPDSIDLAASAALELPEADGQRWLSLEVTVRNPLGRAILVAVPPSPGTTPGGVDRENPPSFDFDLRGPVGGIGQPMYVEDSSTVFFQPFETKRWLYEFRVDSDLTRYHIPPGQYLVRGGYARLFTDYKTITVTP